jgi:hypothetical protein
MEAYLIHSNGSHPFKVVVNQEEKRVDIYQQDENSQQAETYQQAENYQQAEYYLRDEDQQDDNSQQDEDQQVDSQNEDLQDEDSQQDEDQPVDQQNEDYQQDDAPAVDLTVYVSTPFSVNFNKIFIGESPLTAMTLYSGYFGPEFDGNTILLELDENKYMFIGDRVYTFESLAEIVTFLSPIGNNDVPYPYAADVDGNYYLPVANAIVMASGAIRDAEDKYRYFYDKSLITQDIGYVEPKQPEATYKNIKAFYINDEQYTMRLSFTPTGSEPDDEYTTEDFDGEVRTISYEDLQALYQEFAESKGFRQFFSIQVAEKIGERHLFEVASLFEE